ncbi:hypothetical protein CU098_002733 [Rhizopus stolonifer]|uniref:DNA polymerase kappa n=1 Tax=Rhizopus stolonifer TaxID=4846 RepID=A0A367KLW4_RHIST|nr:hypothetical protein CU098_002733 [Rhizopus stolonifer]
MAEKEEEFASQIIEEEEDLFFDQDSEEEELIDLKDNAGLDKVDKDKINKIIYEASKGSAFFENEKKRDRMVTKRIDTILAKHEQVKDQDLSFERRIVDNMIRDLEQTRDLSQCICHVDMDAFYASVEELENPKLKTQPMAVGGMSMLCTSNYEARKYGVRSAMPGFIALKLCPQLKMIPLHFPKYISASNKVRAIFAKYDPNFMPMSLDEAYLNLTEYLKKEPNLTPYELVKQIRREIFESTQLTASAGTTLFDTESERKSVGVERTFPPMSNPEQLYQKLHELCEALEADAEKAGVMFVSFEVRIRSKTLPSYIWLAKDIEKIAKQLLAKEMPMNLRLMGVRLATLKPRGSNDESVLKYFTKAPLPEKILNENPIENDEQDALICPICNRQLTVDNIQFNQHVDECLNKIEVKTILQNEKRLLPTPPIIGNNPRPANKKVKRSSNKIQKQNGKSLFDYYPPSCT